jgi:hypothetical protein
VKTCIIFFYLSYFFLAIFLVGSSLDTYGQIRIEGIVLDDQTGQTLPFANITYDQGRKGMTANLDGQFRIDSYESIDEIEISYVGYTRRVITVEQLSRLKGIIRLKPSPTALTEVVILAGENPALRIIRNAIRERNNNDPEQLQAFTYMAYNKFLFTGDIQDDTPLFDTTFRVDRRSRDTIYTIDSSTWYMAQFLEEHHLFLMESVSFRKFRSPASSEETILSSRVSGIQNPQFSFLATEFQSFSFYSNVISVLGMNYINPISSQGLRSYHYRLRDTLFMDLDTVFIIEYLPSKSNTTNLLKGVMHITTDGWAIQNVKAEPALTGDLQMMVHQKYDKAGDHWFPAQLNYDIKFTNNPLLENNFKLVGRSYLSEININPDLSKENFSGYGIIIDKEAPKNMELLEQYRPEMLDNRTLTTYQFLDSISREYRVEQRLGAVSQLMEGRIRWKYLSFDLNRLMKFNRDENFRLGMGIYTSNLVSKKWDIGGWLGYGFGDYTMKFGLDTRWKADYNLTFKGGYEFELYETGGAAFSFTRTSLLGTNSIRHFFVDQFDEVRRFYLEGIYSPWPQWKVRLGGSREERFIRGDYRFVPSGDVLPENQNIHTYAIADLEFEYAPGDTYMRTANSAMRMESKFPIYSLRLRRGFSGWLGGDFDFWRIDLSVQYQYKLPSLHRTDIRFRAGYADANIPSSYQFFMAGNNYEVQRRSSLLAADDWAFETLYFNEFLANRYASIIIHQEIVRRFFKFGRTSPGLEVSVKALWGTLQNPELHKGIEFRAPIAGYYEAGLMLNKLYNSSGLGVYYRFGPYSLDTIGKNLAFRLTFRF